MSEYNDSKSNMSNANNYSQADNRMLKENSMFDCLLSRVETLYSTLDKQTIVIREKVTKLAVEVNEVEKGRPEPIPVKGPETIIDKLNDMIYKLEHTSDHLSVTLRMLDKII